MVEKKVTKKTTPPVEVEEKVTTKAEKAEKKERKIGLRKFKDEQIVTLLVDYNPKRKGSASNVRFEGYEDGATVADTLKAGVTSGDLSWDVEHGYIKIGDEFDEDAEKKSKPEPKPKKEKEPKAEGDAKPKKKAAAKKIEEEEEEAE